MNSLDNIKLEARNFTSESDEELETKIAQLFKGGVGLLGCIAFIQECKNTNLAEARNLALSMDVFKNDKVTNEFLEYSNTEHKQTD